MIEKSDNAEEVVKALRRIAAETDTRTGRKSGMDGIANLDTPLPKERDYLLTKEEKEHGKGNGTSR